MAIINHSEVVNTTQEQLAHLIAAEREAEKRLQEARVIKRQYMAEVMKMADVLKHALEQHQLETDFRAGDKTVKRDESAGNGAGVYRRGEPALTVRDKQGNAVCRGFFAEKATGSAGEPASGVDIQGDVQFHSRVNGPLDR